MEFFVVVGFVVVVWMKTQNSPSTLCMARVEFPVCFIIDYLSTIFFNVGTLSNQT